MIASHYTFRTLSFQEQVVLVWDGGIYLATRYEEEDTVGLYHMSGGYFVELFYDHLENKMQEYTRTLTSTECLEDYACYIKLTDL
ncbi:hypothetical protein [Hymenobacter cavernae]|uniref:Uncharacterized protein n=1 Tax=Hymenobacter cavernae TaxID=2044852 RepID=A0ABQ1URL4_9BACT|nr:hypothetical protein [Hymenobacter cavernae]GGF23397.1 hypothetical protein GCM10011383_38770 [Hymenobacter cavernae]